MGAGEMAECPPICHHCLFITLMKSYKIDANLVDKKLLCPLFPAAARKCREETRSTSNLTLPRVTAMSGNFSS